MNHGVEYTTHMQCKDNPGGGESWLPKYHGEIIHFPLLLSVLCKCFNFKKLFEFGEGLRVPLGKCRLATA